MPAGNGSNAFVTRLQNLDTLLLFYGCYYTIFGSKRGLLEIYLVLKLYMENYSRFDIVSGMYIYLRSIVQVDQIAETTFVKVLNVSLSPNTDLISFDSGRIFGPSGWLP